MYYSNDSNNGSGIEKQPERKNKIGWNTATKRFTDGFNIRVVDSGVKHDLKQQKS